MENRGPALISWDKVCLPKDTGGLGVLNLAIHNKCLLMKHIHKFFSSDLPWVNLIWSSYTGNMALSGGKLFPSSFLNSNSRHKGLLDKAILFLSGKIIGVMVNFSPSSSMSFNLFKALCMQTIHWRISIPLFQFKPSNSLKNCGATLRQFSYQQTGIDGYSHGKTQTIPP